MIETTKEAFENLKKAMTNPLVLVLLDFNQVVTIQCDASGYGVGVFLIQQGRLLDFMSQSIHGKALQMSSSKMS